jgi:hypothetical protein
MGSVKVIKRSFKKNLIPGKCYLYEIEQRTASGGNKRTRYSLGKFKDYWVKSGTWVSYHGYQVDIESFEEAQKTGKVRSLTPVGALNNTGHNSTCMCTPGRLIRAAEWNHVFPVNKRKHNQKGVITI